MALYIKSDTNYPLLSKMPNIFRDKRSKAILSIVLVYLLIIIPLSFLILADEPEPQSILWKRTPTTEVWKNPDGTYTTTLHSGVRFVDDKSRRFPVYNTPIENASSLKEAWNIIFLENDSSFLFENLDYNYTSIWGNLSFDGNWQDYPEFCYEKPTGDISCTFKLEKQWREWNEQLEDFEELEIEFEYEWEYEDGIVTSDKKEFKIEGNPLRKKFKFGGNSTTITLDDADSENLKDAYVEEGEPSTNKGSVTVLYAGKLTNGLRRTYITFNITSIKKDYILNKATLDLYNYGGGYGFPNISIHHVYNDWKNGTTTNNILEENELNWNNQPCGVLFDNNTNCNLTIEDIVNGTGANVKWWNFSVLNILNSETGNNVTFALTNWSAEGNAYIKPYSKEYSTTSQRPKLTITYTPYIDIDSPTPAQIFTEDNPTTRFNVTTAVNMSACFWSNGTLNLTLDRYGDGSSNHSWGLLNLTMKDGSHTDTYFTCNETDNTWRTSDTVSFDVDSVNVTVCRDLTVSREYYLQKDIDMVTISDECLKIAEQNIILNLNNKIIDTGSNNRPTIGLLLESGEWFSIENGTLFSDGECIQAASGGNVNYNINISNMNLTTKGSNDESIWAGIEINIVDSIINVPSGTNLFRTLNPSNFNLLNVSYIDSVDDSISDITVTRKWYFQTQVNDSNGYLEGATVAFYDKDGNLLTDIGTNPKTTDANGQIPRQEITEYINNGGTKTYKTPHQINISKTDYTTNSTIYNLTEDTNIYHSVVLEVSAEAPTITIYEPINGYNSSSSTNTMRCNSTDTNADLKNVTLFTWFNTVEESKQTEIITGSANSTNFTNFAFTNQGTYEWNCFVCDDTHNCVFDISNSTLNIDTSLPDANLSSPGNMTNTTIASQNLTVNITDNLGIKNATLFVINNTDDSVLNRTTITFAPGITDPWLGIVYNFVNGVFKWFYEVYDWSENVDITQNYTITVDDTPPLIDIIFPLNETTYTQNNSFNLNFTFSDNVAGVDSCWYTNNSGLINYTLPTCGNFTQNLSDVTITYIIFINDTFNNIGSDAVTFTTSTGPPAITLNYPANNQYLNSGTNVYFNFTATDSDGLDACTLVGNWTGSFITNYTWDSPESAKMNWTLVNITQGDAQYKWNVNCSDALGNMVYSPSNFTLTLDTINPAVNDTTYTPSTIYTQTDVTFYANITDTNLNNVILEINYSTTYTNISVTTKTDDQYYYTLSNTEIDNFENISWLWIATDLAGNTNSTITYSFEVLNRIPNTTSITTLNNTYSNVTDFELIWSGTDNDDDSLTYYLYNSTDGITFKLFNVTDFISINWTNFDRTEGQTHYFYIESNDSKLANQSKTYLFTVDIVNPNLTIEKPDESPTAICSLTNIELNYIIQETNVDFCEFNVTTIGGIITTPHTTIADCSNHTFNNTLDGQVQQLNFRVVDLAGNSNSTTRLINIDLGHSSCPQPSAGIVGGSKSVIEEEPDLGFCGDGICQDGKEVI